LCSTRIRCGAALTARYFCIEGGNLGSAGSGFGYDLALCLCNGRGDPALQLGGERTRAHYVKRRLRRINLRL
jgi:hypothetical protein